MRAHRDGYRGVHHRRCEALYSHSNLSADDRKMSFWPIPTPTGAYTRAKRPTSTRHGRSMTWKCTSGTTSSQRQCMRYVVRSCSQLDSADHIHPFALHALLSRTLSTDCPPLHAHIQPLRPARTTARHRRSTSSTTDNPSRRALSSPCRQCACSGGKKE